LVEEAARTIVSGRVFSAAVVHGVRIPGTALSSLRQRKVSTEALKIVREGVGGNVSVDVSDSSITVTDSDTSADVSVFFVYVSQSALASGHAVFHFLVDSTGCFGVPLRWSVNWEAVVRNTDDAGRAAIRAAVAAATVLACCLWEEMVVVAAIRWMTKAMVHRLDLDEDGIAAARIVWAKDGNAVGCVANGTLRSSSAISPVEKSGNTWHTEAHRSGFDEGVLAGQSPSVVVRDSASVDCVSWSITRSSFEHGHAALELGSPAITVHLRVAAIPVVAGRRSVAHLHRSVNFYLVELVISSRLASELGNFISCERRGSPEKSTYQSHF